MTQKDKELLLKDLCARVPYGVHCCVYNMNGSLRIEDDVIYYCADVNVVTYNSSEDECFMLWQIKPYLRPMSSMTEKEKEEIAFIRDRDFQSVRKWFNDESIKETGNVCPVTCGEVDYCNKKHFDYRTDDEGKTMIEKGLALEAPEGMYNTK